jgi:hypothetical protein
MPVANFLVCLDLEQNISFLDRHKFVFIYDWNLIKLNIDICD